MSYDRTCICKYSNLHQIILLIEACMQSATLYLKLFYSLQRRVLLYSRIGSIALYCCYFYFYCQLLYEMLRQATKLKLIGIVQTMFTAPQIKKNNTHIVSNNV